MPLVRSASGASAGEVNWSGTSKTWGYGCCERNRIVVWRKSPVGHFGVCGQICLFVAQYESAVSHHNEGSQCGDWEGLVPPESTVGRNADGGSHLGAEGLYAGEHRADVAPLAQVRRLEQAHFVHSKLLTEIHEVLDVLQLQ